MDCEYDENIPPQYFAIRKVRCYKNSITVEVSKSLSIICNKVKPENIGGLSASYENK